MHIHTGTPGNVRKHGPVRPSGPTDPLALFRYLKVALKSWEVCCQNNVVVFFFNVVLWLLYCIVHNQFINRNVSDLLLRAFIIRPFSDLELETRTAWWYLYNFIWSCPYSSTNTCKHAGSLCISCMVLEQILSEEGTIMSVEMEARRFELAATLAWSWKAVA